MIQRKFKYIFGPVYSWRLGRSLGIDPISPQHKICNLNCIYCQIGQTVELSNERRVFVAASDIVEEIKALPEVDVDYLTFSSNGEPTLALNLGEMISALKKIRQEKIAVITNSVLMPDKEVRRDLCLADVVLAKLDACDQESFIKTNRPIRGVDFKDIVKGIKLFRKEFHGKLAVQVMFVEANREYVKQIVDIVRDIAPDEVQVNTPTRPCAVKPLNRKEIARIESFFAGLPVITVYDQEPEGFEPLDENETARRHGDFS